ncbi:MAG: PIN domain-containing protein [Armatimonadetes bacterium]|nr:PIN domain-containing protein [Armatimonadota bacterium]
MTGKTFVDTNIFLYTIERANSTRRSKARRLVHDCQDSGLGVVSTQVINEFAVNAMHRFGQSPSEVRRYFRLFEHFEIVTHSLDLAKQALEICESAKVSYWDAILIAAASSAKCSTLYTEDLSHGQSIQGLKIVNPFA